MKELKLRAKWYGNIVEIDSINFVEKSVILQLYNEEGAEWHKAGFDDIDFLHCVGVEDRHGIDIYEGDKVRTEGLRKSLSGEVAWHEENAKWYVKTHKGDYALLPLHWEIVDGEDARRQAIVAAGTKEKLREAEGTKSKPIAQIEVDENLGIGSVPLGNKVKELIQRTNFLAGKVKHLLEIENGRSGR